MGIWNNLLERGGRKQQGVWGASSPTGLTPEQRTTMENNKQLVANMAKSIGERNAAEDARIEAAARADTTRPVFGNGKTVRIEGQSPYERRNNGPTMWGSTNTGMQVGSKEAQDHAAALARHRTGDVSGYSNRAADLRAANRASGFGVSRPVGRRKDALTMAQMAAKNAIDVENARGMWGDRKAKTEGMWKNEQAQTEGAANVEQEKVAQKGQIKAADTKGMWDEAVAKANNPPERFNQPPAPTQPQAETPAANPSPETPPRNPELHKAFDSWTKGANNPNARVIGNEVQWGGTRFTESELTAPTKSKDVKSAEREINAAGESAFNTMLQARGETPSEETRRRIASQIQRGDLVVGFMQGQNGGFYPVIENAGTQRAQNLVTGADALMAGNFGLYYYLKYHVLKNGYAGFGIGAPST